VFLFCKHFSGHFCCSSFLTSQLDTLIWLFIISKRVERGHKKWQPTALIYVFFWALFGGPQSFFVLCQYYNDANNRDVKEKKWIFFVAFIFGATVASLSFQLKLEDLLFFLFHLVIFNLFFFFSIILHFFLPFRQ